MFERSELRSRREERMENGVKNLMGNESIPKTFANHGHGDTSQFQLLFKPRSISLLSSLTMVGLPCGQREEFEVLKSSSTR